MSDFTHRRNANVLVLELSHLWFISLWQYKLYTPGRQVYSQPRAHNGGVTHATSCPGNVRGTNERGAPSQDLSPFLPAPNTGASAIWYYIAIPTKAPSRIVSATFQCIFAYVSDEGSVTHIDSTPTPYPISIQWETRLTFGHNGWRKSARRKDVNGATSDVTGHERDASDRCAAA